MKNEFSFIVDNEFRVGDEHDLFFEGEPCEIISEDTDMFDILVKCGVFKSKSQARKNWTRTGKEIPDGFTDLERVGKLKFRITIFKPTKDNLDGDC